MSIQTDVGVQLLPCPFCGGKPEYYAHTGPAGWLECDQCAAVGPQSTEDDWDAVIAAWNKRSGPDADLLEAAEKLLALFDELRSTTVAERIVTGRSDADLRRASEAAIDKMRTALARARGEA